jgi:hypothetical protein
VCAISTLDTMVVDLNRHQDPPVMVQQAGVQPWEELAMIGLHYGWYLGMVFSFLPIWKGLLFVVLSQVGSLGTTCGCRQARCRWRLPVTRDHQTASRDKADFHPRYIDNAFLHALQVFSGFLLSIVFVQSHNGMEVYSDTKDFVTAQIVSTRDITAGIWNDWFTGAKCDCIAAIWAHVPPSQCHHRVRTHPSKHSRQLPLLLTIRTIATSCRRLELPDRAPPVPYAAAAQPVQGGGGGAAAVREARPRVRALRHGHWHAAGAAAPGVCRRCHAQPACRPGGVSHIVQPGQQAVRRVATCAAAAGSRFQ